MGWSKCGSCLLFFAIVFVASAAVGLCLHYWWIYYGAEDKLVIESQGLTGATMVEFLCSKRRIPIADPAVPRRRGASLPAFKPVPPSSGRTLFCIYDHQAARMQRPYPYDGRQRLPYLPNHLPLSYCRYVVYYSLAVDATGGVAYRWPAFDGARGVPDLTRLAALRDYNTSLLVTLGGADGDNRNLSTATYNPKAASQLAERLRAWLWSNRFRGVNIHWPQPGSRCGRSSDGRQLVGFVRTLRRVLGSDHVLAVTLPASLDIVESGFNLDALSRDADYLLATTHSLNDLGSTTVQCPSPVAKVESSLRFLSERIPESYWTKVCPSVSLAGTSFVADGPGLNAAVRRPGRRLARYEHCTSWEDGSDNASDCGSSMRLLDLGLVESVVYETPESLGLKLSLLAGHQGYRKTAVCLAVHDLDSDDVGGVCAGNAGVQSPLVRALYQG